MATLWHVLRVTPLPRSFLDKVRSIGQEFLMHQMFLPIRLTHLNAPKKAGRLGILDPKLQQQALQLRWLHPMFGGDTSFVTAYISFVLQDLYRTLDPILPFLFPIFRPQCLTSGLHPLVTLLKSFDQIPHPSISCPVPAATYLAFPLPEVWRVLDGNYVHTKGLAKLKTSNAFVFDEVGQCLQHKSQDEVIMKPRLVARFHRAHWAGQILRHDFMFDNCTQGSTLAGGVVGPGEISVIPFTAVMAKPKYTLNTIATSFFRKVALSIPLCPQFFPQLSAANRKFFWKMNIPHTARNIWYRALHNKLSCKANLHQIIPTTHPSPICPICHEAPDNVNHFLFLCPNKYSTWLDVSPYRVVIGIILANWQCHWRKVFDDVPFSSSVSTALANKLINVFQNELED
ncbi:hypothetical protein J3Q64DRAFT_1884754 [Phycomyces blakesleeanus]|uniref:Reverse transcriptase zinc-binding domain-containing protein n=1 Tax=Phycomyces blakesleeanus TaxID=4837 RepID=A0ABR3B1W1_PHYBL